MEITGLYFSGILSFLSPCILPVMPFFLATILKNSQNKSKLQHLFVSLFFCAGFSFIFILLSLGAAGASNLITEHKTLITLIAAVLILLIGLHLLSIIEIKIFNYSFSLQNAQLNTSYVWLNAFIMGVLFALTWSPCIGPVLAGILAYIVADQTSISKAVLKLFIYSLGVSTPLIIFSLFTDTFMNFIKNNKPFITTMHKVLGIILLIFSLLLFKNFYYSTLKVPTPCNQNNHHFEASTNILKPDKLPLLIAIHSSNCSACSDMIPVIEKFYKKCKNEVDIKIINIDDPEYAILTFSLNLMGTPTYIFIDINGKELSRLMGYQNTKNINNEIKKLIHKNCLDNVDP